MKTTAKTAPVNRQNWGLQGLLLATSIALGWILLPFYGVILWAVIIALLFSSLNLWLLPRVGNRTTVAALVTGEVLDPRDRDMILRADPNTMRRRFMPNCSQVSSTRCAIFGVYMKPCHRG